LGEKRLPFQVHPRPATSTSVSRCATAGQIAPRGE
jgi:hypothetical protein